jgi:hypothetical protein
VYWKRTTLPGLELNAIGDFLAGVFGPIAFLWLVLGYIQQGRELKLSSEALHLQAQELKNSVEQQKEMVDITRLQVNSELDNLRIARELRAKAIRPEFSVNVGDGLRLGEEYLLPLRISNEGAQVYKVNVVFSGKLARLNRYLSDWTKHNVELFNVTHYENEPTTGEFFTINYLDTDHNIGSTTFDLVIIPTSDTNMFPQLGATLRN